VTDGPALGQARGNLRKHARAAVELPITVGDAHNQVKGQIQFDTQDLSAGGAFIRSDLLFEVGEELGCEIQLPQGPLVKARAKVVRVVRDSGDDAMPGMGIAFLQLSDADREAIRLLVIRGGNG
jgi:c-di-GMP-binding flagellar brake protein YcgR